MQNPSVGRIVHVVTCHTGRHLPAIITEVVSEEKGLLDLTVFTGRNHLMPPEHQHGGAVSPLLTLGVPHDPEGKIPGTWHWPERDPAAEEKAQGEAVGPFDRDTRFPAGMKDVGFGAYGDKVIAAVRDGARDSQEEPCGS